MPDSYGTPRTTAVFQSTSPTNIRTRLDRIAPWIAAAVAVLTFANSLGNSYCYDDVSVVQEGTRIHEAGKWGEIWTTDYWYDLRNTAPNRDLLYRPLTLTSIRFIRAIAGDSALPQRLANVALHALIAGFVVLFCKAMGISAMISLLCGVLFAVLPIHTEVVNATVGRADLLATLCILFAVGSHDRSRRASSHRMGMEWRVVAAIGAFAAMSAKENGLAVIPLVILADACQHGRGVSEVARSRWLGMATLRSLAYLMVPLSVYLFLRYHALEGRFTQGPPPTSTINALVGVSGWQRILGVIQLWGMYWAKTIWPATLNIKYTIQAVTVASTLFHPHVLIGMGSLLTAGALTWREGRRGALAPAYLLAALLICYFPTSNSVVLIQEFFGERLWYLPSLFAILFLGAVSAPHFIGPRKLRLVFAGFIVVAMAMIGRSWIRNVEWKDNASLFAAAYRDAPTSVGVLQLYGDWLTRNGRINEGVELLKQALLIDPGYVDAHRSLAHAYLGSDNSKAAAQHLEMVARLTPTATPSNNLGVSYARQGNWAEAEKMFRQALRDPAAASFAHYNLGLICNRSNRVDEAIVHWEESLRLDPDAEQTVDDLGRLYVSLRRPRDAARIFAHGTRHMQGNPRFWKFLAMILATSQDDAVRDGRQAVKAAEQANTLLGDSDAGVLAVLAAAHAETGAFERAIEIAQRALSKINPAAGAAMSDEVRAQIALYERGEAYRDPRF